MSDHEQAVEMLPDPTRSPAPDGNLSRKPTLVQLFKFGTVGTANTLIDITVLNGLIVVTGHGRFGAWYALFKAVSFLAAVTNSYFMNRLWTFRPSRRKARIAQFISFLVASIVGLVVNVAAAYVVVTVLHPISRLRWAWPSIGALVGSGSGLIWNYVSYRYIVFADKGHRRASASDERIDSEGYREPRSRPP